MYTDPKNFPSEDALKKRLVNQDIIDLATQFGAEPAALMAVLKTESGGKGFDTQNRPKILFEGHIFYNLIKGKPVLLQKVLAEQKNNICYASWGARGKAYNLDQYTRLEEAISFDKEAALKSASWGLGQIMGMNYKACGQATVEAMVTGMYFSEKKQFEMMLTFVKGNKTMYEALKSKQWATFAKAYNGPGYAQNKYDVKLQQVYESYQGKTTYL